MLPAVKYVPATVTDPPIFTLPDERAIAAAGFELGVGVAFGVGDDPATGLGVVPPGVGEGDSPGVGEVDAPESRT